MCRAPTKKALLAVLALALPASAHAGGIAELNWFVKPAQLNGYWSEEKSHEVAFNYTVGDPENANSSEGTTPWFAMTGNRKPGTLTVSADGTWSSGGGKAQEEHPVLTHYADRHGMTSSRIAPILTSQGTDGEISFTDGYQHNDDAASLIANFFGYKSGQQIISDMPSEHGVSITGHGEGQWLYHIAGDDAGGAGKLLQLATFVGNVEYEQTVAATLAQHSVSITGHGEDQWLYHIAGDDAGGAGKLLQLAALQEMELAEPNGFSVKEFSQAGQ